MTAPVRDVPADRAGVATLSIIVCAYTQDRYAVLISGIDALLQQLSGADELIVVIDYNEALFADVAVRYGQVATVMRNSFERGLSGARNAGIEAARNEVLAFVDDDAKVRPGWVEQLRRHYLDPSVAGVGGHATPVWPTRRPAWMPSEYDWVVGCSHLGLPTSVAPVRNFIGCNMSFRRDVFQQVGRFNTTVGRVGKRPVGCEETELCIRISQHDPSARLLFDPAVRVDHSVSDDRVRLKYFLSRCFGEGLSKYRVGGIVGTSDALSSERRYVTRVLPIGVLVALRDMVVGRGARRAAGARGAAIVLGLAATAAGYGYAMVRTFWDAKT